MVSKRLQDSQICQKRNHTASHPTRRKKGEMKSESPRGFITAPTLGQLKPTPREQHLLEVLWDWLEQSKRSPLILGQPTHQKKERPNE